MGDFRSDRSTLAGLFTLFTVGTLAMLETAVAVAAGAGNALWALPFTVPLSLGVAALAMPHSVWSRMAAHLGERYLPGADDGPARH